MPKYDLNFYMNINNEKTQTAANDVLSILFKVMTIRSVIDVGCGLAIWLNSAQRLGAKTVVGIEGNWLEKDFAVVDKNLSRPKIWKITFR